jgi:hypothetical protein
MKLPPHCCAWRLTQGSGRSGAGVKNAHCSSVGSGLEKTWDVYEELIEYFPAGLIGFFNAFSARADLSASDRQRDESSHQGHQLDDHP